MTPPVIKTRDRLWFETSLSELLRIQAQIEDLCRIAERMNQIESMTAVMAASRLLDWAGDLRRTQYFLERDIILEASRFGVGNPHPFIEVKRSATCPDEREVTIDFEKARAEEKRKRLL